jgi:hypothetical protein
MQDAGCKMKAMMKTKMHGNGCVRAWLGAWRFAVECYHFRVRREDSRLISIEGRLDNLLRYCMLHAGFMHAVQVQVGYKLHGVDYGSTSSPSVNK